MNRVFPLALAFVAVVFASQPETSDQQRMLDSMREYAERYIATLPNFVCERVTEQFDAGKKPKHWRQRDTLTARLVYNQGREDQTLEMVNDKPVQAGRYVDQPLETEGEFGTLLSNALRADAVKIEWSRWEELRGSRLAVFQYFIDREHSGLSLGLGGSSLNLPYRGEIYADPVSGEVRRITSSPFDIPTEMQTRSVTTTVDYDPVQIADRRYMLPVSASIWLDTGARNLLNKVTFQHYRKFETQSTITFASDSSQ